MVSERAFLLWDKQEYTTEGGCFLKIYQKRGIAKRGVGKLVGVVLKNEGGITVVILG